MSTNPRPHRRNFNIPGHAHALTFCCYRRYRFLAAERCCDWLADAIEAARHPLDFDLWAWVFMPDHVHLVVHPRAAAYDVAELRRVVKSQVGSTAITWLENHAPEWIPRITRKRGGCTERLFWQSGGGHDRNIETAPALLAMIDYIHLNPVRSGLVERAEQWTWSSASWYVTGTSSCRLVPDPIPPEWL